MALYDTRIQAGETDFTDARMLVLSKDDADLATGGSDYIFDFATAACYATGALPDVGAAIPAGGFVNLARDAQPALAGIPRGAVLLKPAAGATLPTFDGKGITFVTGTTNGLDLTKAGVPPYHVVQPRTEGLVDFVETVIARRRGGGLCYLSNVNGFAGGMAVYADTAVRAREGDALLGYMPVDVLTVIAKITRFDTAAGTSTVRAIFGTGAAPMMADAAVPGRKIADYPDGSAYSFAAIGGSDTGKGGSFAGTIYRVSREYIGRSKLTDGDVLARTRRLYDYAAARFG